MVVEKIIVDQHEITLFNDCYNANPTSMLAALETLRTLPKAHVKHRKIVLLGDMRELGDFAESEHVQLVEMLAGASWLDMAILTGAEMLAAYAAFAKNHSAPANITLAADAAESAEQLRTTLKAGDTLLVKGSRGMKLEEVISLRTDHEAAYYLRTRTNAGRSARGCLELQHSRCKHTGKCAVWRTFICFQPQIRLLACFDESLCGTGAP
jgi:UDP-N-acetylmuramoyl-tripeptide--D-alanyl-D-alanine ligase